MTDTLDKILSEAEALIKRAYDIGKTEALERILNYAAAEEASSVGAKKARAKHKILGYRMHAMLRWLHEHSGETLGEDLPEGLRGTSRADRLNIIEALRSNGWIAPRGSGQSGYRVTRSGTDALLNEPAATGRSAKPAPAGTEEA